MVRKIEMFEATDGSVHRDEQDAHAADLAHLLVASGSVNDAQAKQIAALFVTNHELRKAVVILNRLFPDTGIKV